MVSESSQVQKTSWIRSLTTSSDHSGDGSLADQIFEGYY
jgi:hypothetical protein